jgi:transmembrane sensor
MDQKRIGILLKLYANNLATPEEIEELFAFFKTNDLDDASKKTLIEFLLSESPEVAASESTWEKIWSNIQEGALLTGRKGRRLWVFTPGIAAAAAALLLLAGSYFILNKKKVNLLVTGRANGITHDLPPGGNHAILTLSDGSSISLDTAQNGYLANKNNTKIIKLNTGYISYKNIKSKKVKNLMNTITTPRGGQYELELSDGTKVWLNAASSLSFPVAFSGKERRVTLKGEGYFEVAKNAATPFYVDANNIHVKVLGTHFNIMDYSDEDNINTTLLEGKVTISKDDVSGKVLLEPGRQAVLNKKSNTINVGKANIAEAIAWKNGEFRFKNTGIKELMRQVGRWYDVNVEYQTTATNQFFTASLPRMQNISELLETLELTGTVHFKLVDKTVIVLP